MLTSQGDFPFHFSVYSWHRRYLCAHCTCISNNDWQMSRVHIHTIQTKESAKKIAQMVQKIKCEWNAETWAWNEDRKSYKNHRGMRQEQVETASLLRFMVLLMVQSFYNEHAAVVYVRMWSNKILSLVKKSESLCFSPFISYIRNTTEA